MRNIFRVLFVALSIGLFIMRPISSFADGHDHDDGHGHDYGHRDHSFIGVNFSVWPGSYYYGGPYYPPADTVFVSPPVYQPVVINGITYYLNDGEYYIYNGYGYQAVAPPVTVVPPPAEVVQPPPVVVNQSQSEAPAVTTPAAGGETLDAITINIPNNKGGYTAVTLKRSGNGFVGPQGEFYPEFPKVSQLEVIYGK